MVKGTHPLTCQFWVCNRERCASQVIGTRRFLCEEHFRFLRSERNYDQHPMFIPGHGHIMTPTLFRGEFCTDEWDVYISITFCLKDQLVLIMPENFPISSPQLCGRPAITTWPPRTFGLWWPPQTEDFPLCVGRLFKWFTWIMFQ